MKKMMIVLGAIAVAMGVQAASMDWSIGTKAFKMSDDSTLPKGTTVYLMDTGAENYAALSTLLADGSTDYANLSAVMASTLFTSCVVDNATTYSSANATLMKNNYGKVATKQASAAAAGVTGNYAIFVADGENYLVSSVVSGKSYVSDPSDGVEAAFTPTQFSGGWAEYKTPGPGPGPTPEPTSGLLLLLGVAGLALRRKQA